MSKNQLDRTNQFEPNPTQIAAAQLVFMSMALLQTVEPIVTAYKNAILAEGQWRIGRHQDRLGDGVVTDHKQSYLLSDEDFATYDALCKQARDQAGLVVEDTEQCPLLVAQDVLVQAQMLLVSEMEPIRGITWDMLLNRGLAVLHEYIELTLKLLAPYCKSNLAPPQHHWLLAWRDHVRAGRAITCGYETGVNTCNRPGRSGMEIMDCVRCKSGTQQNRFAWLSHRLTILTRAGVKEAA